MNLLTAAATLFIITAILHITVPVRFGNSAAARPIAAFGVIYLVVGVVILLQTSSWMPVVALVLTLIGGIGATTTLNAEPQLRSSNLLFIGIDVVLIALLVIHLLAG